MAGNSIGHSFRLTTFGESHGLAVGGIVDGCPAGMELSEADLQPDLARRRPGQSKVTTPRDEKDQVKIFSGVFEGKTTGAPIMFMVENTNVRSQDYKNIEKVYRPSHADYTYSKKYGVRDYRGGGRSSARTTLAQVAAGAIAKKYLREKFGIKFVGYVESVGALKTEMDYRDVKMSDVEANIVRCPDQTMAAEMIEMIEAVKKDGDSVGGVVRCVVRGAPVGLGEPVFDKLPADLAKAMLTINACKGFEIGSGFAGTAMRGTEHNDEFEEDGKGGVRTKTNNAGGVLAGISNGEDIHFRVAFKPVSTIMKEQNTVDESGQNVKMRAAGRHDPCVVPRAVPIVEAMAALVVMDHVLRFPIS